MKATGWGMGTEFETFEFRDVSFEGRIEDNHNIKVVVEGKVQVGWNFRLYIVDDDHVVSYATGPPKDAAPTFKATFKMPNSSPLWNQSEPIEFDPEIISLHDVIKGKERQKEDAIACFFEAETLQTCLRGKIESDYIFVFLQKNSKQGSHN